ncbi:hypothetical protein AB0F81_37355 [Actinoplanes sp. NPDC024001]|uniref:HAAS signaling domain-containing protein n=1 Tax=Actinoplanes sp. NPDC024001 TaxID=3154598 RepID=UPI0033FF693C
MTNDALPGAAEAYLRALGAELPEAREIVEDVRAHITDALAGGRTIDQVLAGLGSPQAVARQAREELALPEHTPDHAATAGRILRVISVAVAALTAVWVTFLLPGTVSNPPEAGPGLAILTLVPALLAALPFALPAGVRGRAGAAVAAAVTALIFVDGEIALHYVPLMMMLWAATITPWAMRRERGRVAVRLWHLTAAAFVAFPGILVASALGTEKIGISWAGALLWIPGPLILGALCAFGVRAAYAVIAAGGAVVMLMALTGESFLFAAFWWFGALYLMIGAVGHLATPATGRLAGRRLAHLSSSVWGTSLLNR